MLTIFSIPKPFVGHVGIIQRNAIQSWCRLHANCDVILCADEVGTEATAQEFGARWIANVACNEYGTPLLSSVFAQVAQVAHHRIICYVNADIMLLSDFLAAIQRVPFPHFLLTGQRWNLDLTDPWNFKLVDWESQLRQFVSVQGTPGTLDQLDYFVFLKDSELVNLPPFAVGRPAWDNWFVFQARQLQIPVINATKAVTVVHQNHGYAHVPDQRGKVWEGPEGDRNLSLTGGRSNLYTLADANYVMTPSHLLPAIFEAKYWQRTLQKVSPSWFPPRKRWRWWFNVLKGRLRSAVGWVGR